MENTIINATTTALVSTNSTLITVLFVLLVIWSLIWKGIALWKSARNQSMKWFIALLVINTLGILEILYIFVFSKKSENSVNSASVNPEIK